MAGIFHFDEDHAADGMATSYGGRTAPMDIRASGPFGPGLIGQPVRSPYKA